MVTNAIISISSSLTVRDQLWLGLHMGHGPAPVQSRLDERLTNAKARSGTIHQTIIRQTNIGYSLL
jgi:hypothetical protein